MQPPYDREMARMNILVMRHNFLVPNPPNRVILNAALAAPDKYPGLPEAVMVKAMAFGVAGEKGLALKYLIDRLRAEPGQWLYRALHSEIGVVKDTTVAHGFAAWAHDDTDRSLADSWYLRSFSTLNIEQALAWSHIALTHDPDHKLALENVARFSALTGDLEIGLAAASRLLEMGDPRRNVWLLFRCTLMCRLGRPQDALREIDLALEIYPAYSGNHQTRAQINRWLGDYAAAVEDYTRAISYAEGSGQSSGWYYYHRGTPQWILGRLEEAAEDFRQSYRLLARTSYNNVRLVLVLHELGRHQEAEAALAEARLHTRGGDHWLASILDCLAGEITPAQLVAAVDPMDSQHLCEGRYYAGEVYLMRGRTVQAEEMFIACVTGCVTIDRGNFRDRLSEFELAEWRLSQLNPQK
jgi:tetratricopeptide (TPR) repeat protein